MQVVNLKKKLKEFREKTGKTNARIAVEDLNTTPGTLKFWLSGTRQPYIENLQLMSEVFGCSVTEFMDDPGQEIAGQDASELTEKRRFIAGLMFEGITSDELSDEDAQLLYEDYLANRARLIALKNRMKKQDGAP